MRSDTGEQDASETPRHFPKFPELPAELRWKIWQMAICTDKTPRIHYYQLFSEDRQGHRQSLLQQMMQTYSPSTDKPHPPRSDGIWDPMIPPRLQSRPLEWSWAKANSFQCLWDAGLRTACSESRAAILHHRDKAAEGALPSHDDMISSCHQGKLVYLGVCSRRDIFCFRLSPEDMAVCVSLRWDILVTHLPIYHLPRASVINMAFEFDDSWDEGLYVHPRGNSIQACLGEASPRGLVMRAYRAWATGQLPLFARMWLIHRDARLPATYKLGGEDLGYPDNNSLPMLKWPRCEPGNVFTDGKNRYGESQIWNGRYRMTRYAPRQHDVPVLSFIWKVSTFCSFKDLGSPYHEYCLPSRSDGFFRVLRQME